MSGFHRPGRAGRAARSSFLSMALACAAVLAAADPAGDPSYKEATVTVPIQTEGTPLRAETEPIEFRSIRMRFKDASGGKRRMRLIVHVANTGRSDHTARVEAAIVDESGQELAAGVGSSEVEPGEPEMIEIEIDASKEILGRAAGCRLKLSAWRS